MRSAIYLLLAGLLIACAAQPIGAPVGDRSKQPAHNPGSHTVRQGDTLYSVAFLYGYEVEQLAAWNSLHPPYTIYKGQRLRLKPAPISRAPPAPAPTVRPVSPSQPKLPPVAPSRPKTTVTPRPAATPSMPKHATVQPSAPAATRPNAEQALAASGPVAWSWPARGPFLQGFDAAGSGKKGISIGGHGGEPVRAAAAGKVVYAGSGLAGYGRLIIIKHNKDYLSAYAHNRTLDATEGQWVDQGQVIAEMGNSGTDRVKLYFEIRKQGRPVDPLQYLPRQ